MTLLNPYRFASAGPPAFTGIINTFEGASADGDTITAANSGGISGDAFDSDVGTIEFDTDRSWNDSWSMRIPSQAAVNYMGWDAAFGSDPSGSFSFYFRTGTAGSSPTSSIDLFQFRDSGGNLVSGIALSSNAYLLARNSNGTAISGSNISGHYLMPRRWYRIDFTCTVDTASTGTVSYGIYDVTDGETDIPISAVFTSTTEDLGTANIDSIRFGCMTAAAMNSDYNFDTLRVEAGGTTLLGAYEDSPRPFGGLINTLEGGTDATTISAANSGGLSGDAWEFTSGGPTYTDTWSMHGGFSMRTPDNSSLSYARRIAEVANWEQMSYSFYFEMQAFPASLCTISYVSDVNSSRMMGQLKITSGGRLVAASSTYGTIASSDIAAHNLTAGNKYRIDVVWQVDLNASFGSSGRVQFAITDVEAGDSATPDVEYDSEWGEDFDDGSNIYAFGRFYLGALTAVDRNGFFYFDTVRIEERADLLGPHVYPVPDQSNSAEGGSDSDTVTTGNSGGTSGDAWSEVGGSPTFEDSPALAGSMAYAVGAQNTYLRWTGLATTTLAIRCMFRLSSTTGLSGIRLIDIRTASQQVGRILFNASGYLYLQYGGGGNIGSLGNIVPTVNTNYILELVAESSNSSDAVVAARWYAPATPTTIIGANGSTTISQGTTANITSVQFGRAAADSYGGIIYLDQLAEIEDTLQFIGPPT